MFIFRIIINNNNTLLFTLCIAQSRSRNRGLQNPFLEESKKLKHLTLKYYTNILHVLSWLLLHLSRHLSLFVEIKNKQKGTYLWCNNDSYIYYFLVWCSDNTNAVLKYLCFFQLVILNHNFLSKADPQLSMLKKCEESHQMSHRREHVAITCQPTT